MEDQVFALDDSNWKSVVLTDSALMICNKKHASLNDFHDPGMLNKSRIIALDDIHGITMNSASSTMHVRYDKEGKEKKMGIEFDEPEFALEYGTYIGAKLQMNPETEEEQPWKPLAINVFYLLLAMAATAFIGLMDPAEVNEDSGSRKTRTFKTIVLLLHETIGQIGIFIIGGLIVAFLAYRVFQRFSKPATNVTFSR
ncbi:MAG: hypothetical protein AB8F95_09865 [Bacteroidia bacterium]